MSEQNDKNAVEEKNPPPKPPGYRKFEKLLKQVVKAPPMSKIGHNTKDLGKPKPLASP
jgi:hypothetical protein